MAAHDLRTHFSPSGAHTRVLAAFHCDPNNIRPIRDRVPSFSTLAKSHDGLGKIVGFTSNKTLGAASGTWSLTVKKDAAARGPSRAVRVWKDPEDVWVQIKSQVDGQVIDTMLGLIDSVSDVVERVEMGKRIEVFTISGRDFGKVPEQTEVFVNLYASTDNPVRGQNVLSDTMERELVGTPAHFMRVLLELWVGSAGVSNPQYMLPQSLGGRSFYDSLRNDTGRVRGIEQQDASFSGQCAAPLLFQMDQTGGRLWDVLQEMSNGVMNELFFDLAPRHSGSSARPDYSALRPQVTFRERPFPTRSNDGQTNRRDAWDSIRKHTLTKGDVLRSSLAKGGASTRFNYWTLNLEGIGNESFNIQELLGHGFGAVPYGTPGNIPIFNNASIALHGVRRFQASTRYVPIQFDSARTINSPDWIRLAAAWLKKLHDWYAIAPRQVSGTLETTRLFPEIRIGERVKIESDDGALHMYVEGVAHSYSYPGPGKTTLTLTRGEYEDEDLLGDLYAEYELPMALSEADENALLTGALAGIDPQYQSFNLTPSAVGVAVLEIERDGTSDDPDPDALASEGRTGVADPTEPSVGDAESTPTPNPAGIDPEAPAFSEQDLNTGQPIRVAPLDFTISVKG